MTWDIDEQGLPPCLREKHSAPKQMYIRARDKQTFDDLMSRPRVGIVGSRNYTDYGAYMTKKLASALASHGVVIVSGLALGIDAIAHRAALEAGGQTLAVLPTHTSEIYPRSNINLARDLLVQDGALVSEYPPGTPPMKQNFVARNRIVSGMSDALLVVEAAKKSGALHTATFAMEQGITVMAVPGNVTSATSVGANNLLKKGASPVTRAADIFHILGRNAPADEDSPMRVTGANEEEQSIIDMLEKGIYEGSRLFEQSGLTIEKFNYHLTMMEISAKIRPLGGNQWALA